MELIAVLAWLTLLLGATGRREGADRAAVELHHPHTLGLHPELLPLSKVTMTVESKQF